MKGGASATFIFALLLLSFTQVPARSNLSGPEPDDESDFNYIPGSGKGPEDWWRLNPSWWICKYGMRQSPICLEEGNAFIDPWLGQLETNYIRNQAILKNRGHDIMLAWPEAEGGGSLYISGTEYTLVQCHWHTPAEHEIDGQRPDLEMHMVHQSSDDKVAVIGILYKIGFEADPFLSELMNPLRILVEEQRDNVTAGPVEPWRVNGPRLYYRYMGSLTTPPCTEGVVWTVLAGVQSVSQEQVDLLKAAVHDGFENNARPLQPINGRPISLSWPWIHDEQHPSS
uniref:Bifunctional monodehydroascorbate reductase and carbonic anhydrase nectarin-3 n=1 Tax=Anthurium amnicola TaxID=1678845 RepID=A0A1D1ZAD8_9ARAE